MLSELRVKNFALIKDLSVQFDTGLNVLTGETGAGKSLILKSLNLLMGGKAPSDLIGSFSDQTLIEGLFLIKNRPDVLKKVVDLSYDNTEEENTLLVRRIISSKGKSKTYLNGSLTTVTELKSVIAPLIELSGSSEPLIELTNQHDNKNLQNTVYQRDLFDLFCKNKETRVQVSTLYSELKEKRVELNKLLDSDSDRLQKIDFLNFQLSELEEFKPEKEEYDLLKSKKQLLQKSEQMKSALYTSQDSLSTSENSALSQLYSAVHKFKSVEENSKIASKLEEASEMIEACVDEIKSLKSSIDDNGDEFVEVEARLKTYEHLFRKYTTDSLGLSVIYTNLLNERKSLEAFDETRVDLENELSQIEKKLKPLVEKLTLSRSSSKNLFETTVSKHLNEVNMKDIRFKVKIIPCELTEHGAEEISFWLSYTKGDLQERSIKKAASGGELSRILLAIKSSLEKHEAPRTYLFDEIDSGVSGPTADKVGKKLRNLSNGQQVITITHLPQVAALGEHHFLIKKSSEASGQRTQLLKLKQEDRVKEVARLISGETLTKTSLNHASQLMELR